MAKPSAQLPLWLLACAIAWTDPAAAQFTITVEGYRADGYVVSVDASGASLGPCPRLLCRQNTCFATIEPCPPGMTCHDGTSTPITIIEPVQVTLAYGVTYRFNGYWLAQTGPRVNNECTFTCFNTVTLAEVTQRFDRDEIGQWTATPLEHDGLNVWVAVGIVSDYLNYSPCGFACLTTDTRVIVSPCPLAARLHLPGGTINLPVDCVDGRAVFNTRPSPTPDPALDLLFAPGDYVVDGHWATLFFAGEQGGGCGQVNCAFTAYPNPTTYSTNTLAVQETTWGRIKALYRN